MYSKLISLIFFFHLLSKDISCNELGIRQKAQSIFKSDTLKYWYLDRDGDGKACENIPEYRVMKKIYT